MNFNFKTPNKAEINKSVISFYSMDGAARDINSGLMKTEEYLINNYFKKKGKVLALGCGGGARSFCS